MIKKIKRIFSNLFFSLPFAMKGGDDAMLSQKASKNSDTSTINTVTEKKSLGGDLLKGEVTEQVEELRYKNYKVYEESNNYDYNGDGSATKKASIKRDALSIYQDNRTFCKSILDSINSSDYSEFGINEYTLKIIYDSLTRFKLESYCKAFKLYAVGDKNKFTLFFEKLPDSSNSNTYHFIEYFKKIIVGRSEFDKLSKVSFTTYKANGEKDLIKYTLRNLILSDVYIGDDEMSLTYSVSEVSFEDLTSKFYSKEIDEKYRKKEKKNIDYNFAVTEGRKRYCSECGKEINVYDGDITENTFGYPLCEECIKKHLTF